jgi:hypothetical protein
MKKFLSDIGHLYKIFETPARMISRQLPLAGNGSYIFKSIDRNHGIWQGFVTDDCSQRFIWGYHVVLEMCLPLAFHFGFKRVVMHGCLWNREIENVRMRDFFSIMGSGTHHNMSEVLLPYETSMGITEHLWLKAFDVLKSHYEKYGMSIDDDDIAKFSSKLSPAELDNHFLKN